MAPRPPPPQEWRDRMEQLSATSCAQYKSFVYEHPLFVDYFRAATPLHELAQMNIGSRPARRSQTGGVDTLRAIPYALSARPTPAPPPPPQARMHLCVCVCACLCVCVCVCVCVQVGVCVDPDAVASAGLARRRPRPRRGHPRRPPGKFSFAPVQCPTDGA
jgi:hypothetical protein